MLKRVGTSTPGAGNQGPAVQRIHELCVSKTRQEMMGEDGDKRHESDGTERLSQLSAVVYDDMYCTSVELGTKYFPRRGSCIIRSSRALILLIVSFNKSGCQMLAAVLNPETPPKSSFQC